MYKFQNTGTSPNTLSNTNTRPYDLLTSNFQCLDNAEGIVHLNPCPDSLKLSIFQRY